MPAAVVLHECDEDGGGDAVLVPDNIVSFMHILYSTIPVIRKGTDSRLGFGFRFGPHADAQVVLELGPQRRTGPLTVVTTQAPTVYDTKRHVSLLDEQDEQRPVEEVADNHLREHRDRGRARALGSAPDVLDATRGGGGEWLSRWRAGWSAPAAPGKPTTTSPPRTARAMRIALAPAGPASTTTTTSAPPATTTTTTTTKAARTPQSSSSVRAAGPGAARRPARADPAATSPRTPPSRAAETSRTPPVAAAAHLREAMATLMSSRPPPRVSSPTRATAAASGTPRQQGFLLHMLRQLWQAGTRAANH